MSITPEYFSCVCLICIFNRFFHFSSVTVLNLFGFPSFASLTEEDLEEDVLQLIAVCQRGCKVHMRTNDEHCSRIFFVSLPHLHFQQILSFNGHYLKSVCISFLFTGSKYIEKDLKICVCQTGYEKTREPMMT